MRTLTWRFLCEYILAGHADLHDPLREWCKKVEDANWSSFADVRQSFQSVDQVGNKLIFNVRGNSYRLTALVSYPHRRITTIWIGTQAEYDRLTRKDIEQL